MRFALMIEPQMGLTYAEQLAVVRRAEAAGFQAFFRSDHYESFPGGSDEPTTDAWAVLAGLARDTSTIRLGALVSPVTFRSPGNLAKVVATVNDMSSGRVELGVGAGWHAAEHRRHGFPFPEIAERAEMLEETLEIVRGLWSGPDGWSFAGKHFGVEDTRFRPKPSAGTAREGRGPNVIVGGNGTPRSYRIAARYADEFNLSSASADTARLKFAELDATLRAAGREPSTLVHSVMAGVLVGRDAAELAARETALLAALGEDGAGEDWLEERRARWVHGTPQQARDTVRRFEDAGAERIMLQDFVARDLDMIDLAAEAVMG